MFWRVVGSLFVGTWIVSVFQMFACDGVAFEGAGRRVVEWSCIDPDG